ncbi:transglycosylase domain-containing protein [Hominifimenecus sp. rT4P-3]|uniref:transglycosylase domain-containing protein n=1 Tax=Hominifimenecus sp. rT4P-3 TaxID=3242979 RepID=UPI003DA536FA
MDFGRKGTQKQLKQLYSKRKKIQTKSAVNVFKLFLVAILFVGTVGGCLLYGMVNGVLHGSPDMGDIDVSPKGLATKVYDAKGNQIETLIASGANRSPVTYDQIPQDLVNAFVAIEDERFWTHEGVDVRGILRAGYYLLSSGGETTQGASTITQQLIKNNVFEGGAEKTLGARFVRKIQEQYLAIELEKTMSKEKILENYLNTINLGANCLGVQTASKRYFGKDVSELTLSECATIAAITQNPYKYNPITHPEENVKRRATVLQYMEEQGKISKEQQQEALADDVYDRIQQVNATYKTNQSPYSYFVDRLTYEVARDLQEKLGYSEDQAYSLLYSGGLQIFTTQDPDIQAVVDNEVSNPENYEESVTQYSFTVKITIKHPDETTTSYTENDIKKYYEKKLDFPNQDEIYALIQEFEESVMEEGDVVLNDKPDITLQPQTSAVVIDQSTGHVLAITGGRGAKTTSLSLNRATNTRRQPGSTFKVLTSFAPAIDAMGQTLASTYYDEPYTYNGKTFKNWYSSSKFAGYANIRQGIVYSMNIVALKCLVETVSPNLGFEYAENFGINTLIKERDAYPSLALGGVSQGVTNMQLTAAYASIANGGIYNQPILYTKILDSDGKILIDNEPESHRVIKESTAFLLTSAMQESMEDKRLNGLFSSSSPDAHLENMSAAGKSGTTSDVNDLWFVGYTPYYTMAIWSGFDDNSNIPKETDRDYHKVIWKKIMEQITAGKADIGFGMPEDIVQAEICSKSGKLASDACRSDAQERDSVVYTEYFVKGTEPTEECDLHYYVTVCSDSNMKVGPYCPNTKSFARLRLPEETTGSTQDSNLAYYSKQQCDLHLAPVVPIPGIPGADGSTGDTHGTTSDPYGNWGDYYGSITSP